MAVIGIGDKVSGDAGSALGLGMDKDVFHFALTVGLGMVVGGAVSVYRARNAANKAAKGE